MKPDTAEKLLVWILRTAGAVCALAIMPMLMPTAWAQAAHAAIGLGELPGEPIVMYLVRGMSAMCALYGGLLLLLASLAVQLEPVVSSSRQFFICLIAARRVLPLLSASSPSASPSSPA